jgi:pteridine reductase
MSKAAITEMVRSLARELAPDVRINAIAPGVVAWPEGTDHAEIAAYEKRIPLARSGTPEEAATLALFLARDNTYITGQTIPLDGGRSLA